MRAVAAMTVAAMNYSDRLENKTPKKNEKEFRILFLVERLRPRPLGLRLLQWRLRSERLKFQGKTRKRREVLFRAFVLERVQMTSGESHATSEEISYPE